MGKIRNPEHFDNVFFGIHRKMAESLDVLTRLCLERSIEAIVDAGIHNIKPLSTLFYVTCYNTFFDI